MGKRSFDPEKFAQDFQLKLAEEEGGSKTGAGPEELPAPDVAPVAGPERAQKPIRPEDLEQKELNKIINDFSAKQSQIAETRAQKTGRFASLAKSLGIKTRNLDDDPEVMNLEKESNDLYRSLLAKGINLYKSDKPQLENFLRQFDEFEVFRASYNQEMEERAEFAKWPESVLAGFHKIGKRWGELKKWQQIAISMAGGSLVAGTALAVGAGAITGLVITSGWRWGFRGFVSAAAGIGRKIKLDKGMLEGMSQEKGKEIAEIMKTLQQYENDIDAGIALILDRKKGNEIEELRNNYEKVSAENTKKALWLTGKTFLISTAIGEFLRLGGQYTGINLGSILKRISGYVGFGGGAEWQPELPKALVETPGIKGHGGGPPMVEGSSAPSGVKLSVLEDMAQKTPATGAEVHAPEIAKPQFEEIASVKVKAGGTMWGNIENNIRANPSAYELDPKDPDFTKDMHRMTKQMLDEFASRKGLSYEQLDQIARTKVQVGDTFKIIHDPLTNDLYLDDYHGKAFGADVSQTAPAEEIALNKPKIAPEELRTKTGPAEYPAQKSASQIRGMEELDANQKLYQQKYARAVQAKKDLAILHERQTAHLENVGREAHLRQVLATRGLLNRIVEGAGIGNNVSFWESSALEWHDQIVSKENYIPQDVQLADEVEKLNLNLGRLKELFLKLGKPGLGQSMGDYLHKAMKNSRNVELINQIISRK